MLTLNHQQQQSRREFASTTPTLKNKQSTAVSSPSFDTTAVTEKVNEWFGSFSSWSSSVKNSLESTITSLTTDDSHSDEGASSSKQQFEAKTTQKNTIVAESSSLSSTNKNNLSKKLQPTTQTSLSNNNQIVATTNTTQTNMLKDKRSMRQDFGEDDEESLIGTLKKGSLLKPSTSNGSSWLDSFQNIKSQIFSEKTEEDDGPLAKSLSSKTNSKTSSPVTSQNNLLDSLSSTFTSLKTQTGDKWAVLSSQFFETQPPIDENDNSFLGRLTKEFDGMVTLTAKQRMYGFFMALGFGLLCILIALGFLPSILFASGAFAFFYTFGNLLCLISTLFLVGPASQLKNMSKPERAIPSALFVGSMFLTLLCVFFMPLAIFIIILVIVQTISLAWYVVSYIPFAQSILGMVFSSFMKLFN